MKIATKVPPPDRLKEYKPEAEPDGDEGEGGGDDDDKAAKVSAMADFMEAVRGKPVATSEAEKALEAYDRLCDVM